MLTLRGKVVYSPSVKFILTYQGPGEPRKNEIRSFLEEHKVPIVEGKLPDAVVDISAKARRAFDNLEGWKLMKHQESYASVPTTRRTLSKK